MNKELIMPDDLSKSLEPKFENMLSEAAKGQKTKEQSRKELIDIVSETLREIKVGTQGKTLSKYFQEIRKERINRRNKK